MTSEESSHKATASLGQAQNLSEDNSLSHDQQLREQCCARIQNPLLDQAVRNSFNGTEAIHLYAEHDLKVTIINAGETPLTWAHVLYLSLRDA